MSQCVKFNSAGKSRTVSVRKFILHKMKPFGGGNQENLEEQNIARKKKIGKIRNFEFWDEKLIDKNGYCT